MTGSGPAVGGPLSTAEIRRMVATVWPDWDLVEADRVPGTTDAVYFLTVTTDGERRDVVLKACGRDDAADFRPEPYLLDTVRRETNVPVPAVYGTVDDHDDLPAPFFLMERCPGETVAPDDDRLDDAALDRVAREAGRSLGEVHDLGSFARFGRLRLTRTATADGDARDAADVIARSDPVADAAGGISGPGYEVTVERGAHDDWRDWFDALTDALLSGLPDRFADLEPAARDRLTAGADLLDGEFEPVPVHANYRFGDLLVEPASGETLAVLDFADEYTADAEYNLAAAEHHLCGWVGLDADRRERVRERLLDGYRETNALRDDGALWDLYDLYLLATWLCGLRWFEDWHAHMAPGDRDTAADVLRNVTRQLTE